MAKPAFSIDQSTDRIPKPWNPLPFINKQRLSSIKKL